MRYGGRPNSKLYFFVIYLSGLDLWHREALLLGYALADLLGDVLGDVDGDVVAALLGDLDIFLGGIGGCWIRRIFFKNAHNRCSKT